MIICGTGHRPNKLGGYGQDVCDDLIELARKGIELINTQSILLPSGNMSDSIDAIISGMALGWDQALATAAIQMDIKLIAAIPFIGQEKLWPAESQDIYNSILEKADQVTVICEGSYNPSKMQVRNEWMVNKSELVLALWDGTAGGTYNCVKYARERGITVRNLWDRYKIIRGARYGRQI